MREKLQERNGVRTTFRATFARFGTRRGYQGRTLTTACFVEVLDAQGVEVADHVWMTVGKQLEKLGLQCGDVVEFVCRVQPYRKGYLGYREDADLPPPSLDYKLARPTQVRKIVPRVLPQTPDPMGEVPAMATQLALF